MRLGLGRGAKEHSLDGSFDQQVNASIIVDFCFHVLDIYHLTEATRWRKGFWIEENVSVFAYR